MPPRITRTSIAATAPKTARNKNKKRSLNAYAQAQKLVPEKGIPKHRLGEDLDDRPRQKRRRLDDEDEDEHGGEDNEDEPQRKRPSKRPIANRDDDIEYGSDSEGNEWTVGGIAEGEEDSDLDSDEAFGDSDEERFQGFTFRGSSSGNGKSTKKSKPASARKKQDSDIDLNEEEQSDDDSDDSEDDEGLGLGDDAVDLAAMLDDDEGDVANGKDDTYLDLDEESGVEDEDGDEEGSSSELESENDDEDAANEEAAARMRDRLEALDSSSSHALVSQPSAVATLDDFLEDTGLEIEKTTSKSKKKPAKPVALAAPLPKRQQDRLDREVATDKAKEELEKWLPGTKQIRRAEHISFPLQHPDDQGVTLGKDKFTPSTQNVPQNELEESIQRIMEQSGLATKQNGSAGDNIGDEEAALIKAEDLAVKQMPVEEVMRRRAELRRARELLFREEIKAKRLAKIKSKSHRRVMRKQKEREREALEALGRDEIDEDEKERAERKRAEARMSTKHKDSKWAKTLKETNRTAWDEDARDGVNEQARRNEELKRRIEGKDVSEREGSDLQSSHDGSDDDEISLKNLDDFKSADTGERKGLLGLKFMRDADGRRRKANDEDVERLRKELAVADGDEIESEAEEENLGRAIFGPQAKESRKASPKMGKLEFEAPERSIAEDEDEQEEAEAEAEIITEKPKSQQTTKSGPKCILKNGKPASSPLAQGWLKEPESKRPSTNGWLQAPKSKSKKPEANADVNLDLTLPVKQPSKAGHRHRSEPASNGHASNTDGWTAVTYNQPSDFEAEAEPSDPILTAKEQKQTLQQRAFAGDDVQAAFDIEKEDLANSEDENEISHHLPGWGSWTGDGLSKSIRKANASAKHNPLFKTKVDGVRQADRKDAKLKNVIISEKQDRKGKKYLAPVLPHEFETKEQYERSRRVPMGPEWTTKEVHQKMTRPRVIVKPGVNLRPLEKPLA